MYRLEAEPYYEAYINADCKLISPASANYQPLTDNCKKITELIGAINQPYIGNSNTDRLAWLKRRRALLMQRAAVIATALKDLGSTDVIDHTAVDVRTVSGLVAGVANVLPGVGQIIGLGAGIVGQVISGFIDNTKDNKAERDTEIALYQADYARLQDILNQTNKEIDKLSIINYLIASSVIVLLLILVFKKKK